MNAFQFITYNDIKKYKGETYMPVFTNQAQLSYNGITTNSNITTGEIIEVLSATKNPVTTSYSADDTKTYVLNIINSGNTAFTNLTITDNLGAYTYTPTSGTPITRYPLTYINGTIQYYQNGVLLGAPTVTTTNGLTISGIGVPANGVTTLIYQTAINEYAPLGIDDTIVNTATITGTELTNPIVATATIETLDEPFLTIFKSITPRQVPENGQLTYTFDIQNLGNTATIATDNVQIRDVFSPILSNITVTYNGVVLPAIDYTYDETTGLFATNPGVINVPAATYTQDTTTGIITTIPGTATLNITGTI